MLLRPLAGAAEHERGGARSGSGVAWRVWSHCVRLCVWAVCTAAAAPASAQGLPAAPPGPFAIDVRGTTIGMPQAFGFYPEMPSETLVPARGFGLDAGAHVYFGRLGPGRLGVGANIVEARGTTGSTGVDRDAHDRPTGLAQLRHV